MHLDLMRDKVKQFASVVEPLAVTLEFGTASTLRSVR